LPTWKTEWQFFQKLKIELSYDPAILPLDKYFKIGRKNWDTASLFKRAKGESNPNVH
jgi:hypothetical protein